ncbi:MAG: hypothetical protein KDK10_00840 [Maritimibacter sp.]|nr:hypothetical protein [Maritimibacter sp.]
MDATRAKGIALLTVAGNGLAALLAGQWNVFLLSILLLLGLVAIFARLGRDRDDAAGRGGGWFGDGSGGSGFGGGSSSGGGASGGWGDGGGDGGGGGGD